jgi:copper(I)-binding protein
MVVRRAVRLVLLLSLAASAAVVTAQEKTAVGSSAWVREPAAGQTSTPAFAVIDNPTMYELWIVSARTDAAASVELREARKDDPAQTAAVKEINVPAYGKLEMTDAGVQLMLVGLTRLLKRGDVVTLMLTTDTGSTLKVDAAVRP